MGREEVKQYGAWSMHKRKVNGITHTTCSVDMIPHSITSDSGEEDMEPRKHIFGLKSPHL